MKSLSRILLFWSSFLITSIVFAGEKILLIGDSHSVGPYGIALSEELRKNPSQEVQLWGSSGSTPASWENDWISPYGMHAIDSTGNVSNHTAKPTPRLARLLSDQKPQRVVVSLGTNFLWATDSEEQYSKTIRSMIHKIKESGAQCTWVGPPKLSKPLPDQPQYTEERAKKLIRIRDLLKTIVTHSECEFIDSFSIAEFPVNEGKGDGIHFETAGPKGVDLARLWAKSVAHSIKESQNRNTSHSSCRSNQIIR